MFKAINVFLLFLITTSTSFAYDESECTFYRFRRPLERLEFPVCVINVDLPESIPIERRRPNERIKGLIIGNSDAVNDESLRIFQEFPDVTYYGLLHHNIEAVSIESFRNLNFLEGLDISIGKLSQIEHDSFIELTELVDVDLSRNQLDYIHPQTFAALTKLQKLTLNDNQLQAIEPETFNFNRKLTLVNLRNNKLAYVHPRAFEGLVALRELYLVGNLCLNQDYKPPRVASLRIIFAQQCRENSEIIHFLNERRSNLEGDYE